MSKRLTQFMLSLILSTGALEAAGQAKDWVLSPGTRISFSPTASVSSLPGTSTIGSCGASLYQQYTGVISDGYGHGMVYVNNCGVYDLAGAYIFSGTYNGYDNVFSVPGQCAKFYSLSWRFATGTPHYNRLTLREINASNPAAITEVSSTDIINDGYMHLGAAIAVAPLAPDGTRKVYLGDGTDLRSITISASGVVGAVTTLATLPATVDTRTGMEVSPDGSKIVISTGNSIRLYDVASNTFTKLGAFPSLTVHCGMEYVPYPGDDRIYISYHGLVGSGVPEGLGYVSMSALTSPVTDALSSIPGGMSKAGFGYTDIERGLDGNLYFAYNTNYASQNLPGSLAGGLWSMAPGGSMAAVTNSGTPVTVRSMEEHWAYIIQKQIDGEVYNWANSSAFGPYFDVNGISQSSTTQVPALYKCGGSLTLNATMPGVHSGYTLTLEGGTISYTTFGSTNYYSFTPNFSQPSGNSLTIPYVPNTLTTDLFTLFNNQTGLWLSTYTGPIRITMTSNAPCGNSLPTTQFFNLIDPTDFLLASPVDQAPLNPNNTGNTICSSSPVIDPVTGTTVRASLSGAQDRNSKIDFLNGDAGPRFEVFGTNSPANNNNVTDPTTTPVCRYGWQGATTAGIAKGNTSNPYTISPGTITKYNVRIEEYTQSGGNGTALTATGIVPLNRDLTTNLSNGGFPLIGIYVFDSKTVPIRYFTNNYQTIKGVNVYKLIYTAYTNNASCSTISSVSYFKIMDDGLTTFDPDGGVNWRKTNNEMAAGQFMQVYPNPATGGLNFRWNGSRDKNEGRLAITDMVGRTVIQESLSGGRGSNVTTLDISALVPGIYHYSVSIGDEKGQGSFTKK